MSDILVMRSRPLPGIGTRPWGPDAGLYADAARDPSRISAVVAAVPGGDGGGAGGVTDGDKGHIVVSASGTIWELDPAIIASFAPVVHSHAMGDVTGLVTALAGKEASIAPGTIAQYWRGDKSWQTLDKAAVGLANVDNTSDADKAISSATQTALDLKAPLASPALTGTPSAPTPALATNSTQIATTAFVQSLVANLIASAPGALDTLDELAAAMGDDPNFAASVTTALAGKQPLDATLTALAGLAGGADKLAYFTGADVLAQADLTAFGRTLLALANYAALRAGLNVADGATANAADSALRDRSTHTGTQLAATISDFAEAVQDVIGALIEAAGGSYDDTAGTVTFPSAGGSSPLSVWDYWNEAWGMVVSPAPWAAAAVSAGTNNTSVPSAAQFGFNRYGAFLRSGTTANGGYRYTTSSVGDTFGTVSHKFRCGFLWRTSFTGRTVRIGYHDTTTNADAADGAYFEILDAVCSAKTASNSTRTTNATTITLALDKAYVFDVEVNAAATEVRFRIYENQTATPVFDVTNTTNIPTTAARTFGSGIVATEVTTTASDIGVLYMLGEGTNEGYARARG
jgi:hypothetical protein